MFVSNPEGAGRTVLRKTARRTDEAEPLTAASVLFAMSSDDVLVFGRSDPETRDDLYTLPLYGEASPVPLLRTEFDEEHATLSPDGRWFAYTTDEAGQEDIYARPFPNADDDKQRISTEGGREPLWGPHGALYYRGANGMMAVAVDTESGLRVGTPKLLFEGELYVRGGGTQYDIAPDGRFLMIKPGDTSTTQNGVFAIQNWHQELKRLVPVD